MHWRRPIVNVPRNDDNDDDDDDDDDDDVDYCIVV